MNVSILLGVFVLAFLAEGMTEYLFADLFDLGGLDRKYLKYVAAVVGVAMAVLYRLDLLSAYFGLVAVHQAVGWVLTGLVIGRGANYVHDLADRYIWHQPGPTP